MDDQALAEFVELANRKRQLDAELKSVKKRLDDLEPRLLDDFTEMGMQNTRINGTTVYIHRQLWASAKDGNKPALIDALKRAGLDEMVNETFNHQTLSAWARELDSVDEPIPDEVEPHIEVAEKFSLRTRR